jgi:hypothetical protein
MNLNHVETNRARQAMQKALRLIRRGSAPQVFTVGPLIFVRLPWLA